MVKKKALLISILFFCACAIPPTYKRRNVREEIKKICKKEFNINVVVKDVGETIWIYAPFKSILNKDLKIKDEVIDKMRKISLSISRVLLSLDKPPKFYVTVVSDIYETGADIIEIVNFEDLKKFFLFYISDEELADRTVIKSYFNLSALGDETGTHIPVHDIDFEEFLCELMVNKLSMYFTNKKIEGIKEIKCDFDGDFYEIYLETTDENFKLTEPILKDILKIFKFFIKIYEYKDFLGIKIYLNNKELEFFSFKSLENIKPPLRLKSLLQK